MEFVTAIGRTLAANSWGVYLFAVVFATLAARYLAKLLFDRLAGQLRRTHNPYDDALLEAARKPIGWAIWSFGILFAAEVASRGAATGLFVYIDPIRDVVVIGLLVWFAIRFVRFVEQHVTDHSYRRDPVDKTTASAIGKLLRASVLITGTLVALQSLGFSVTGVLAFGGLGGIAVGFAARDMLANFFGALMLFLDRPFAVGDWIRSPDKEIEGTVEEIGWRMTRIRTFDQRPLYVPNSTFGTLTVENPSRMFNRRIYEIIGLRYADLGVLQAVIDDVRDMLAKHETIDTDRTLIVNFLSFGPSSLDFMVYAFTKTTAWTEFHAIKEELLLAIAAIVGRHNAELAFPTRTVHIAPPPGAEPESRVASG